MNPRETGYGALTQVVSFESEKDRRRRCSYSGKGAETAATQCGLSLRCRWGGYNLRIYRLPEGRKKHECMLSRLLPTSHFLNLQCNVFSDVWFKGTPPIHSPV